MKKTAEAHWEYIEALTEATLPSNEGNMVVFSRAELIALIGFHYKSAFAHGWKHALEAQKSCARDLRSAVSGAARRVLDADNSEEDSFGVKATHDHSDEAHYKTSEGIDKDVAAARLKNIADFSSDYGVDIKRRNK